MKKLSTTQIATIQELKAHGGRIMRIKGGFWTWPDCPLGQVYHGENGDFVSGDSPRWNVGVATVLRLEELGFLERANEFPEGWRDTRRLTAQGAAYE